jgi:hypothetical protein
MKITPRQIVCYVVRQKDQTLAHRPAIVVEVLDKPTGRVALAVFAVPGRDEVVESFFAAVPIHFLPDVSYADNRPSEIQPFTWHWGEPAPLLEGSQPMNVADLIRQLNGERVLTSKKEPPFLDPPIRIKVDPTVPRGATISLDEQAPQAQAMRFPRLMELSGYIIRMRETLLLQAEALNAFIKHHNLIDDEQRLEISQIVQAMLEAAKEPAGWI